MDDVRDLAKRLASELEKRAFYVEKMAEDPVPEITRKDLDNLLKENKVVVLYFTADWCGPCITFLETFRDVALRLSRPGVAFARVDVDRSYTIADKYNVQHIPTIVIIRRGEVVDTILGSVSREELEKTIKAHMKREGFKV